MIPPTCQCIEVQTTWPEHLLEAYLPGGCDISAACHMLYQELKVILYNACDQRMIKNVM